MRNTEIDTIVSISVRGLLDVWNKKSPTVPTAGPDCEFCSRRLVLHCCEAISRNARPHVVSSQGSVTHPRTRWNCHSPGENSALEKSVWSPIAGEAIWWLAASA